MDMVTGKTGSIIHHRVPGEHNPVSSAPEVARRGILANELVEHDLEVLFSFGDGGGFESHGCASSHCHSYSNKEGKDEQKA